jgi:15-cis-phytoene synthase
VNLPSPLERAALVAEANEVIRLGSQSFNSASRIFSGDTRERARLLYTWCRAADDMTDGQELGHGKLSVQDAEGIHAQLQNLTYTALVSDAPVPLPFAAIRQVARETKMPAAFIDDHLAGFALDARDWRPTTTDDLLRYCYHVAGSVGCMMAVVMGIRPEDSDTLDRACDLGLAFQLANIARDLVADAEAGRCYVPRDWLAELELDESAIADPTNRAKLRDVADRLVSIARPYRISARIGASRLPYRSKLAVLAADAIYGAIGEKVVRSGTTAWDSRVRIAKVGKSMLFGKALVRSLLPWQRQTARTGLWQRPQFNSDASKSSNSL